jgi:hypothetical protein
MSCLTYNGNMLGTPVGCLQVWDMALVPPLLLREIALLLLWAVHPHCLPGQEQRHAGVQQWRSQ